MARRLKIDREIEAAGGQVPTRRAGVALLSRDSGIWVLRTGEPLTEEETDVRVTVRLPNNLVEDIDRHEKNRSRFVAEAVRNELERRRRVELQLSLAGS